MKKVVIAGGTGFIGSYLANRFRELGDTVILISNRPGYASWHPADLEKACNGADMVINLAGKTINCRHNEINRQAILKSRVDTTMWIGNALLACKNPPKLWINASASAIYKPSTDKAMIESEKDLATDFLAEVVSKWENVFFGFQLQGTRQVALRTSVVLGKDGGALSRLIWLSRFGLGGRLADGNQMMSWIHVEDYFRIVLFLSESQYLRGAVNCTTPVPNTNKEFMLALRKALHVPIGIPAPGWAVSFGARLLGTEPELILNSTYLLPQRLQDAGYHFAFPEIDKALADILK